jgi:hypothetical protein
MVGVLINIPSNIIRISRPGSPGKLLTTKENEDRIRLAKEDRREKLENRYLRRADQLGSTGLCQELEITEGLVRLRDFLLTKLAMHENTLRELSGGTDTICKKGDHRDLEGTLQKIKNETVEALMTLA